jgi:lysophospholipase L1-like esterase
MKLRTLLAKTGLLLASNLVALVALELALRASYPLWADYNSEMWRYATQIKERSASPGQGHQHRPGREAELYGTTIRTNNLGLREERETAVEPALGSRRVLLLGDSITLAWGVDQTDSYGQVLERSLEERSGRDFEVLNAGVGNYNSAALHAAWQRLGHLQPDVVVVGFYINDIEHIEYPGPLAAFFMKRLYLYPFFHRRILGLFAQDYREFYADQYADPALSDALVSELRALLDSVQARNVPVVFVNIPELHSFEGEPFPEVRSVVEDRVLTGFDACYADLLPHFAGHEPTSLWVSMEDHHPNAAGHDIIARGILESCGPILNGEDPSEERPQ